MKINTSAFVLDYNLSLNKKFYFISGSEITYMEKVKQIVISGHRSKNSFELENIKNLNLYRSEPGLFSAQKIYLVDDILKTNENDIDRASTGDDIFVFKFENSPKIKTIKNIFLKRKDSWVIECYELSKEDKKLFLNKWLQKTSLKLDETLYWWLLENLDERYAFLEQTLEKIEKLENKDITKENLNQIISSKTHGLDKMFFEVLSNNEKLIDLYNKKISNLTDVASFYYSFKQYSFLIINNNNESDFTANIPRYLFREKSYMIDMFRKYNDEKKKKLLKLLMRTERSIRVNGELSMVIGLRFLLNFRKLTIS